MGDTNNGWMLGLAALVGIVAIGVLRGGGSGNGSESTHDNSGDTSSALGSPSDNPSEDRPRQLEQSTPNSEPPKPKQSEILAQEKEKLDRERESKKKELDELSEQLKEAEKLRQLSSDSEDATRKANDARVATFIATAEAVGTSVGGPMTQLASTQIVASVEILKGVKDTIEANKNGESVADPVVSIAMNVASKVASIVQATPVVGTALNVASVGIAVKKDVETHIKESASQSDVIDASKQSEIPQVKETLVNFEQQSEQIRKERNSNMEDEILFGADPEIGTTLALMKAGQQQDEATQALVSTVGKIGGQQKDEVQAKIAQIKSEIDVLANEAEKIEQDRVAAEKEEQPAPVSGHGGVDPSPTSTQEAPSKGFMESLKDTFSNFFASAKQDVAEEETALQRNDNGGDYTSYTGDGDTDSPTNTETPTKNEIQTETETSTQAPTETETQATTETQTVPDTQTPSEPTETDKPQDSISSEAIFERLMDDNWR
jgi:hypothetical protein